MNRRNFLKLVGGAMVYSVSPQPTDATAHADPSDQHLEDIAFGRPVEVSSTAYAPTPGALAVDGSRMSWWTSAPQDPAWIQVDLQARCVVERIVILCPHKAGDPMPQTTRWTPADVVLGSYPIRFTISLSLDGKRWKTIFQTESGVGGELYLNVDRQPARYVRLVCRQRSWTNYGLAISSLEVYGTCAMERPPASGWTAPRVARRTNGSAQPPNADGELVGGWDLDMIGPGRIHAEGAEVSSSSFNSRSWYEAVVPGTVLTTLVEQGVFPDPLFGLNNLKIPEALNKYSWWYRKTFKLPTSYRNQRVWLHFDGINYTAEVWLNRHRIGEIKGAFTRGIFDITKTVKRTGVNALAVKVNPVPHPGLPNEQSWNTGAGPNGGQPTRDGPNFFCTVGWDWIPGIRDRCTGIWSGVHLRTSGAVTFLNPHVKTKLPLPDTSSATLSVAVETANGASERVEGILIGRIGDIVLRQPVSLDAGQTKTVAFESGEFPQLVIKNPHLWWPNGYGQPHLYTLSFTFEIDGRPSDSVSIQFGIRQFEYEKSPELIIKCNGHKIMCRGGDWGLDEAMKRLPARRMEAWIRLHHLANLNIIRNWTGESNSEDFFAQCDRYGIMVWTEFWMANPADGPDPDDAALLLANAEDTIKRYRNHPSIAVWCGRNEGSPPPDINDALLRMTSDLDGTRYYQPGSSFAGVQSGGPYSFREPATYFKPDFDGFKTEIGSVSVPTLDSLRMAIPVDQLWPPHNDTWAYHDYCLAGASYIPSYEAAMQRRFGSTSNIEDFVKRAQMLNYEVYRGIFEGYLSKLWNHASGVILWMSHPAQRSTVWQLYAHDLEAHASLYGAKKGCEPIHIQLSPVDFSVDLINHNQAELPDITVSALVYNLDGSIAKKTAKTIYAAANQKTTVFTLQLPETLTEVYFVRLTVHAFDGALIADNFYWLGSRTGDLQAMNRMPLVRPKGRAGLIRDGEMVIATVEMSNISHTPAIAIKLTPRKDGVSGPASRILPAFISDNYFSLMPGESKAVTAEFHAEDIGEHRSVIEIGGWNIAPQTISAEGGRFTPLVITRPASGWAIGPFERSTGGNPILKANSAATFYDPIAKKEIRWESTHVFNPAAIAWNGKLYVLFRAEDNTGSGIGSYTSRVGLAESTDGIHFTVHPEPVLYPIPGPNEKFEWPGGCEDPRIVQAEDGTFYLTYTMWNRQIWQLGVATSSDLLHWEHRGTAFGANFYSKSGAIVTCKIGDRIVAVRIGERYYMYWHNGSEICLADSNDLLHWSPILDEQAQPYVALPKRSAGHFDSNLTEPGPPALLTDAGIILFYNGVSDGKIETGPPIPAGRYSAGQALFAADNPGKLLARPDQPYFWPQERWEKTGQYSAGTTFTEGLAWFKKRWYLFYGGADTVIGMATAGG